MTKDIKKYTNEYGPLVSIIVPIYNAEKYLKDCLESIKNQTYKNIEVIMVDDGSKDGSAGIARRYASSDSRFIYILQENSGVSVARNTGLKRLRASICVLQIQTIYSIVIWSGFIMKRWLNQDLI